MELALQGKFAFIAGGSRGIGAAIAHTLLREGMSVFVVARNRACLEELENFSQNIKTHCADLTTREGIESSIKAAIDTFGKIDTLVCNLGNGSSVPWGKESLDEWHRVLDLNLISTALTITTALPHLEKTKGSIICISSICGQESLGAPVTYSASKAALNRYVKDSSRPLSKYGIRINAIAPGNIFFPGGTWDEKTKRDGASVDDYIRHEVPLARFGLPEEISNAVAFLASSVSSFTTGAILTIDGGQTR